MLRVCAACGVGLLYVVVVVVVWQRQPKVCLETVSVITGIGFLP